MKIDKDEKPEDDDGSDADGKGDSEKKEEGGSDDSDDQLARERESIEADIREVRYQLENLAQNVFLCTLFCRTRQQAEPRKL